MTRSIKNTPEDITPESRLTRIEQVVIRLEDDMSDMTKSVNSVAESMKQLVEIQKDQALLKQEVDLKFEAIGVEINQSKQDRAKFWKEIWAAKERDSQLSLQLASKIDRNEFDPVQKSQIINSLISSGSAKFAWLVVAGLVTTIYFSIRG